MRYFGELFEDEWNGDIRVKYNFSKGEDNISFLRTGTSIRSKSRDFYSANFYYNIKDLHPQITDIYNTDSYLSYENVSNGTIQISKNSQPRNKYFAEADVYAAFVDFEFYPVKQLLMAAGVRYEHSRLWVNYWTDAAKEMESELIADDLFPAINLKYNPRNNQNIRFSLSRTVTRPSFIEMAPFEYKESYGGATIRGNADIQNGYNYNVDVRYELFQGYGDMYSFGVYYKYLDSPIECVQEYSGSLVQSFRNVDKGTVAGASPYLINLDLSYTPKQAKGRELSFSAVYNLRGPRISSVGINSVSNVVEEAFSSLDFIANYSFSPKMKLKFQAKNIINQKQEFTQKIGNSGGEEVVEHYKKGLGIGFSYTMNF